MTAARLSPTANLLRKSRLFALPQPLSPSQNAATSRTVFESDTMTLSYPIRAAIETPASSLARGDWGLKRPLPSKSTSDKSSKPVVRVKELDTFEHVTDFESAADHTITLQKFQELHIPVSLPAKVNFVSSVMTRHQSPFDSHVDNSELSEGLNEPGAKRYRHTGPWLAGQSETQFETYLKKLRQKKPELLQRLKEQYIARLTAERRARALDNGENLEGLDQPVEVTETQFQTYLKNLRGDPNIMGLVIFELLDLPSPPAVPNNRIGGRYFECPGTKLSAADYAVYGPPRTHPSAGLSYSRTHAMLYNHPSFGPQTHQRPVEARILQAKKRYKGRVSRAIIGVGGIASEDINGATFADQAGPSGLVYFDASIPGGGKYWVSPVRSFVDSKGHIKLISYRATTLAKSPYDINDYEKPSATNISDVARGEQRTVPRLDRPSQRRIFNTEVPLTTQPVRGTDEITRNLLRMISS